MARTTELTEIMTDIAEAGRLDPLPQRRRERVSAILIPIASLVLVVVVWELAIIVFHPAAYLLPSPRSVGHALWDDRTELIHQSIPTIKEILLGFALSIPLGIGLAVAMVASRPVERAIYPLLVAAQTLPKVALAPLLLVWFGFGMTPKVIITFVIAFFPIVIETSIGLRSLPQEMLDLARSTGASQVQLFRRLRFPHALPNIFGGLKVAITLAVIGAVVGEFVGSSEGLGYLLQVSMGRLDTAVMFAAMFVLVVIGVVLYAAVDAIERVSIKWHVSIRSQSEFR